jgi:hypothetical protein
VESIIIYGFGNSRNSRPFIDKETVWSTNNYWEFPQNQNGVINQIHPTLVFQIHDHFKDMPVFNDWSRKYDEHKVKVIVTKPCGLQNQELIDPDFDCGFKLTSSVDFMLLYAWLHGIKSVELVGIDFLYQDEYLKQMPGAMFNVDLLRQRGVKVIAPMEKTWEAVYVTTDWTKVSAVRNRYNEEVPNQRILIDVSTSKLSD